MPLWAIREAAYLADVLNVEVIVSEREEWGKLEGKFGGTAAKLAQWPAVWIDFLPAISKGFDLDVHLQMTPS